MSKKTLSIVFLISTLVWMFAIFMFSNTPAEASDNGSKSVVRSVVNVVDKNNASKSVEEKEELIESINIPFRKVAHATVYFVLAILLNLFIWSIIDNKLYIYNIISIVICFLYACTDEWHQTFIVGRSGEFSDVLIDTCGAIIACLVFDLVYKLVKKNEHYS